MHLDRVTVQDRPEAPGGHDSKWFNVKSSSRSQCCASGRGVYPTVEMHNDAQECDVLHFDEY